MRGGWSSPFGGEYLTGPERLAGCGGSGNFRLACLLIKANASSSAWLPPEPCPEDLAWLLGDRLRFPHRGDFEHTRLGISHRLFESDRTGHLVRPRRTRLPPGVLFGFLFCFLLGHEAPWGAGLTDRTNQCSLGALRKRARSADLIRVSMVLPSR